MPRQYKSTKSSRRKPWKKHNKLDTHKYGSSNTHLDDRFKMKDAYRVHPEPFPTRMVTRAKYANDFTLLLPTPDTGNAVTFRANSPVQCRFAAGAASVVGLQQLQSIYESYLVTGCKVICTFYDVANDGITCGIKLRIRGQTPTLGLGVINFLEQPLTYSSRLSDTGNQKKCFSLFIRPWSLFGLSKLEYMANSTKYAGELTNPAPDNDNCFFDVWACDPVNAGSFIRVSIRIIYYMTLYNRKKLRSSGTHGPDPTIMEGITEKPLE